MVDRTSREIDRRHVFYPWAAQARIEPVVVTGGAGARFTDDTGASYLDFASQLVHANLGLQHPRLVAAIHRQADRLCTVSPNHATDVKAEAARLIATHAPGELDTVFFTTGGAEAVENAIRLARLHSGRHKILAAYRSYHGATAGAVTATGEPRRWASEPGIPGVVHFFGPYLYRSAFHATTEAEERDRALEHLEQVICFEGPDQVAAILLEPVVGTNGVLVPPDGYLAGVRELCDRYGILLVADEVMVGFGRVGEWFAVDAWNVVPDLLTFAKGVNSGYVPLGGVVLSPAIAASFADHAYPGGLTYSGHPLACAVAAESVRVFEDDDIPARARRLGDTVVAPALAKIAAAHPSVGEVRGRGLFWAIELVADRDSRRMLVPYNASGPAAEPMSRVLAACKRRGVWPFTHFNRLQLAPPLIIDEVDLAEGLAAVDEALAVADEYVTG
jgi:taurine--2-oxoglutarate transaminase